MASYPVEKYETGAAFSYINKNSIHFYVTLPSGMKGYMYRNQKSTVRSKGKTGFRP